MPEPRGRSEDSSEVDRWDRMDRDREGDPWTEDREAAPEMDGRREM
jgi:hypothetical protein